jgi:hypothetical protein
VGTPLEVTLYRKPGCGLCDQAEAMLERIGRRLPLRVTVVDIDADPALQAKYFLEIPVILARGDEIARAPISERPLEAALRERAEGAG